MVTIRTREGAGGSKYEVIVQRPGQPKIMRMFRRQSEARLWAAQQERRLRDNDLHDPPR
jgi:hypothetical protein